MQSHERQRESLWGVLYSVSTDHLIFRVCGLYDIFGSPDSSKAISVGLCDFPDPLGSLGLRLYGPFGLSDPLGSPGSLALVATSGYLFLSWFLWF
jgi:hypothetical protein